MRQCRYLAWLIGAAGALAMPALAAAELKADQVFVVYNRNLVESRNLAEYYVRRRGLPATHSIGLDLPNTDDITREAYLTKIRMPLRSWLQREKLQDRIRCLVTMYGVPLRISGTGVLPADRPALKETVAELDRAVGDMQGLIAAMAEMAAQLRPASQPVDRIDPARLIQQYDQVRDKVLERFQAATAPESAQMAPQVKDLLQQGDGEEAVVGRLRANDPAAQQVLAAMRADLLERGKQARQQLSECPRGPKRPEAHAQLRRLLGARGLIEHLQNDKVQLEGRETHAALDSELALLWWEEYPLYRWVANPLCWRVRHAPGFARMDPKRMAQPVMMVARLDATTPRIVRRMIDDAIAIEKTGLDGKVYVDARGIAAADSGYGQYDEDLRRMAELLSRRGLSPVLDNKPDLFAAGQCPDAALYCGWYSLGKYVDAFAWSRGSVGYHIASSEAVNLHNPRSAYWCKRMLEEGVTATLGPVAEPYLHSFPRPRDFFGLLLTGQYTLAEVYWQTCPLASWMQTLLGDPLYTPFRANPRLKVEDVFPTEWLTPAATQAGKAAA